MPFDQAKKGLKRGSYQTPTNEIKKNAKENKLSTASIETEKYTTRKKKRKQTNVQSGRPREGTFRGRIGSSLSSLSAKKTKKGY
jgi:hypothetical protein